MESPRDHSLNLLVELEPRGSAFWSNARSALHPVRWSGSADSWLWRDVFVQRRMPWWRFLQSAVLHLGAIAVCWMISDAWLRQQDVLKRPFDPSSVITYSPQEYLPPLDTGKSEDSPKALGDPVYSRQPIISVPPEGDNRSQTIIAPPNVRLTHDVPMPNIIAAGEPIPAVPLDATRARLRTEALDTAVVAPAPSVDLARSRAQNALTSNVIAPPPEINLSHARAGTGLDAKIVEPPPAELPTTFHGRTGPINVGPNAVVAPAPELALAQQHTFSGRGSAGFGGAQPEAIAPPPSLGGGTGSRASGRLVALGIRPAAVGPVVNPGGNRRGTFAATPEGRPGASGTPGGRNGSSSNTGGNGKGNGTGSGGHSNSNLPAGLHVGDMGKSVASSSGLGSEGGGAGDHSLLASAHAPRVNTKAKPAAPVPPEKITETDRKVFGSRRAYSTVLNMPNLNSATGSWIMRFAELNASRDAGDLLAPEAIQKSDPGYPMELMRENVQGTVTLYAVINADGIVEHVRVLDSPDDRLDAYARNALSRWKFEPALKNGSPVALETVVRIPFRTNRSF